MLAPAVNTEVEDFFERNLDAIALAMKEPDEVHRPDCPYGKRVWVFTWRWPFVHTWTSGAVCCCGINDLLRRPSIQEIDLSHLSPRKQLKMVKEWDAYLRYLDQMTRDRSLREMKHLLTDIKAALNTSESWHAKMKSLELIK